MKIMVTGHRPQYFTPESEEFAKKAIHGIMKSFAQKNIIQEAISGMALGVDTWWALDALKFEIPLASYLPFEVQANSWSEKDQEVWRKLRSRASREVIAGDEYSVKFFHARNQLMVNDCDLAVAVWDSSVRSGGTYSAVLKIKKAEKPYILVDLNTFSISKRGFGDFSW